MNPADTARFKTLLLERAEALRVLHETAQAGCDTVELDQTRVGRLSRMDAMQSQAMNQAAQRRREAELVAIGKALKRIEADDYGYCEQCDEAISHGRLEIDPTALFCIQCADKKEQG